MPLFPFAGTLRFIRAGEAVLDLDDDGIDLPLAGSGITFPDDTEQSTSGGGVPSTPPSGGYTITNIYLDSNKQLKIDYNETPVA